MQQRQISVDELRAQLSAHLRSSANFSQQVYRDQPIIMTGRQMKSFIPEPISTARQIARRADLRYGSAVDIFYEQARYLAGYEDDFEFTGDVLHYFPTYEDLNNEQLRGYFAWRTKVRRGQLEAAPLSFAFIYLYELINLIGVASAREGYETMRHFGKAYKRIDGRLARYFDTWLDDFVIYYQLEPSLLQSMSFSKNDAAYVVLVNRSEHSDDELFAALRTLSSYAIEDSPFFADHEAELQKMVVHAYRTAANHHDAKLKKTLCGKLFGRMKSEPYRPFARAVFADPLCVTQADYELSPCDTIYCRGGLWHRARYASLEGPVPWLSQLMETSEYILRDAYEFPNTLDQPITTKYLVKELSAMAARFVEERREREARAVHIDFGKLASIRQASEVTCDKLIVEEEADGLTRGVSRNPSTPALHTSARDDANNGGCVIPSKRSESRNLASGPCVSTTENPRGDCTLTPAEREFVEALLSHASIREFEHAHACMASVLIDAINEKLYDEFADICIDASADSPQIIEDYVDDLKELIAA